MLQALLRAGVDPAAEWDPSAANGRTAWHAACSGLAPRKWEEDTCPDMVDTFGPRTRRSQIMCDAILACGWRRLPAGLSRPTGGRVGVCTGILALRDGAGRTPLHTAAEALEAARQTQDRTALGSVREAAMRMLLNYDVLGEEMIRAGSVHNPPSISHAASGASCIAQNRPE